MPWLTMSKLRFFSTLVLGAVLALVFWIAPDLSVAGRTPEQALFIAGAIFIVAWIYLFLQGYPVSHGDIGSASAHNLDNIMSGIPAIVALFAIFVHFADFWPIGPLNLFIVGVVLACAVYDLYILGGAASKINRLTDEFKGVR